MREDHRLEPGNWRRLEGLTSLDLSRAWKMRLSPRPAVLRELCSPPTGCAVQCSQPLFAHLYNGGGMGAIAFSPLDPHGLG